MDEGMLWVPKMWQETNYAWDWGMAVANICFSDRTEGISVHAFSAQMNQRRVFWSLERLPGWLGKLITMLFLL